VIDEPVSQILSSQKHPRGDVPSRSGLFNHKNYGFGHGNLHHLLKKREREILDCLSQNSKRFSRMDNAQKF